MSSTPTSTGFVTGTSLYRTRYRILTSDDADELEARVNEALEGGWALVGGVSVSEIKQNYTFAQALTKLDPLFHPMYYGTVTTSSGT